ncbi:6-phosphogluconolactonase [Mucilaginibacter ginkgonis]|uniref:6-phosphogluconolactonase n=1 Tax=Mucilaginibacter ginkgonis TaxID=2682091 RepID=A0A6I4HU11_9SPHI|nr:6-phosphogluconolactonase [Mucilaginibacter ginkgonis]QQL50310.1 6-phosphogluconolactonase [Mucilaginibacter ginkgonis]
MKIVEFNTVEELNEAGLNVLRKQIETKKDSLLCLATGSSSTGIYQKLAGKTDDIDSSQLKVIKLDEWAGMPMAHPASCEYYLRENVLTPLQISEERYIGFDSQAADGPAECKRIADFLQSNGPIDVCFLGLGLNGHVAFNEPAETLDPAVRLSKLSNESLNHSSLVDVPVTLSHGYTLGLADILRSKTIILVVHGASKKEIMERLRIAEISTNLPASFLYLHNNAYCYYCEK